MLKSNLCDYCNAYILASGTINVAEAGADDVVGAADGNN